MGRNGTPPDAERCIAPSERTGGRCRNGRERGDVCVKHFLQGFEHGDEVAALDAEQQARARRVMGEEE